MSTISRYPQYTLCVSQEQVKEKKICFLTLARDDSTLSFAEYKGILPASLKPERRFRKFYCLKLHCADPVSSCLYITLKCKCHIFQLVRCVYKLGPRSGGICVYNAMIIMNAEPL